MIRVPAIITAIKSMARVDGLRLQVDTQELQPEDEAEIFKLRDQIGHFVFAPAEHIIKEEDIPELKLESGEKSPSQRLRGVLWVLHEKKGGKPEDFEIFYRRYLEKVITKIKETISELESY